MKKLSLIILLLFLVPLVTADIIDEEVSKKIDGIEIPEGSLSKVGWFLPIQISLDSSDSDYVLELDEDHIEVLDDYEGDHDIIITATEQEFIDGFNSESKDVGVILTKFKFETQSFKGSVITIGLEKAYDKELIQDPSFGQKVTRWIIGIFV